MIYAAFGFWVLAIVFCSFGIRHLWAAGGNWPARILLAPGLIVHEMSHVLACLLTGATVKEVGLYGGAAGGKVEHTKPAIPVLGQALISLAPLIGCGACLWLAATGILRPVSRNFALETPLPSELMQLDAFGKYLVDVLRETWQAVSGADYRDWRTYAFLYLASVMVIHMSPSRRDLRSGIASIVVLAVALFAVGQLKPELLMEPVRSAWPLLTVCLALALSVLGVSLLVIGVVRLVRLMLRPG